MERLLQMGQLWADFEILWAKVLGCVPLLAKVLGCVPLLAMVLEPLAL